MIDGHSHLHEVWSFGRDKNTIELAADYTDQLDEAGLRQGIVVVRPYEVGLYSDDALRELAKWTSPKTTVITYGAFNENAYQQFQYEQESAYRQIRDIEKKLLKNHRLVKLLRSDDLHYLLEYGKETEAEDVLRKAKEAGFVGIKLWLTSGLNDYRAQLIRRAIQLGLGRIQFHTSHSHDINRFLTGEHGVSLPDIAEQIIQENGKLYLVHGADLPLSRYYTDTNRGRDPLERLLRLSRYGIWLGTSDTRLSVMNGNARKAFLESIDRFPDLREKICFETDYPAQGAIYKLPEIVALETRRTEAGFGTDIQKRLDNEISEMQHKLTIKEVVDAVKTEFLGLDDLQMALFSNAESFAR